jgi:hypothetical protein
MDRNEEETRKINEQGVENTFDNFIDKWWTFKNSRVLALSQCRFKVTKKYVYLYIEQAWCW